MKNNLFTLLLLILGIATSCSNIEADLNEPTPDPFALESRVKSTIPEKIPVDAYINTLLLAEEGTVSWVDYDTYYRNGVLELKEEPYFDNLQWVVLDAITERDDFLEETDLTTKEFYLDEMFSRSYINFPATASAYLEALSEIKSEKDLAALARSVRATNQEFLSKDGFKKHEENNATAYVQLGQMGYTRHGVEK